VARGVAAFDAGTVATVAAFQLGTGVPRRFVFVNGVKRVAGLAAPAHIVKQEELWLRAEEGCVTNTG